MGGIGGKADKTVATLVTSTPSGSAKISPESGVSSSTGGSGNESLMSKFLVDPTAATPSAPKRPRSRARLDSLKEMEEKERKKEEEMEKKER